MSGRATSRLNSWRDRIDPVALTTVLASLIVLGVIAVFVTAVRGARIAYSDAVMRVAVAEVAEDAIRTTAALQQEQAMASIRQHKELVANFAGLTGATADTDEAMQSLRVVWSEYRDSVPTTLTPPVSEVLSNEVELPQFREAASPPDVEPTEAVYDELVSISVAATTELIKQGTDPATAEDRTMLVSLLAVADGLHDQRLLVLSDLTTPGPPPEELILELDLVTDNLRQGLLQARGFAADEALEEIEELRIGESAQAVAAQADRITTGSDEAPMTPPEWFAASSARIDRINTLIPEIHARVADEAAADLTQAERSLWTRSILLGALLLLSILMARNAVMATREREEALAEYGQLTDGLRQWFVAASFPEVESVEIAARYVPASVRTESGGDWYDVYELGKALAVVIGDVAGHGAEATAQMAQVRNILRGQSTAQPLNPADQMDLLNRTIAESGIVATLTYGLLDVDSGEFVYTRAGHIPLLIRSTTGVIRIEEEAPGPPVGGGVALKRQTEMTRLQPGETLILITDGLIEGIDRDIDVALDELAKALSEVEGSQEAFLDRMFGFSEGKPVDDAAALLLTWIPPDQVT